VGFELFFVARRSIHPSYGRVSVSPSTIAPDPEFSGRSTSGIPVLSGDRLQTSFKCCDLESIGLLLRPTFLSPYPSIAV
jgi:hypothetical protein